MSMMKIGFVQALGTIGKDAVPLLIEALQDDNKNVRLAAIEALALIGPDAKQAMPFLIALLDDRDDEARKNGIEALAKIEEAVPQLIFDLGSSDARRRTGAAAALGKMGQVVPKLTESLRNPNPKIRAGIILAFMNMDPGDFPTGNARQRLLDALRDSANDSDEVVVIARFSSANVEPETNNSLLIHKTADR
jgi:HEAT repeat protein